MLRLAVIRIQHNTVYVAAADLRRLFLFAISQDRVHGLHSAAVFRACADDINSRRVDTAVAENIRQFCDVLFDSVEHPCEQVAQIVRKDLLRIDPCLFA